MNSLSRRKFLKISGAAANRLHHLCALYSREALPRIEQFLAAGRFKLLDLLKELRTDIVDSTPGLPFFHPDLLANVNDPPAFLRLRTPAQPWSRP